jgi:GABA(A) receptor-associated protein
MTDLISFKSTYTLEERKIESARIKLKYPDSIPVIVEKLLKSKVGNIDKKKYLVPCDFTVGQFICTIRKRISITPDQAIYIFVNHTLPPIGSQLSKVYADHMDEDGFLYIQYSGESSFGCNRTC